MIAKRNSPDYQQILAYVKKPIALEFKGYCKKNELEISQVIEDLITDFLAKKGLIVE